MRSSRASSTTAARARRTRASCTAGSPSFFISSSSCARAVARPAAASVCCCWSFDPPQHGAHALLHQGLESRVALARDRESRLVPPDHVLRGRDRRLVGVDLVEHEHEIGLGLGEALVEGLRVDLEQGRARLHHLVLGDVALQHLSRDLGRDPDEVRLHQGVRGRRMLSLVAPDRVDDGEQDGAEGEAEPRAPAAGGEDPLPSAVLQARRPCSERIMSRARVGPRGRSRWTRLAIRRCWSPPARW